MSQSRLETMEGLLRQQLEPAELEIVDESHLHRGHAGAADGKGHFRVEIVSEHFEGRSRVQRHRMVFEALQDLMDTDIHALGVHAYAPGEREG